MTFACVGAGIALLAVVGLIRNTANDWREA
ncbi:hypothetical protein AWB77_06739 [Caballeronia fortuita]|uniref:Uncharacterized protein n=1 Tax=Caballeronia fortuita TaxID=1777138 RepID=A0A158E8L2_9BURK|nr:hypothetical protein AWB77_06739 [Caballeronia fortuita]